MILDTSVLIALLFDEPELEIFMRRMAGESLRISAGNWLELIIILARRGRHDLIDPADRLSAKLSLTVAETTLAQVELARLGYLRFGKGSGHPAKLNFGDCFAYALSMETGEPLLFKGDDFAQTDVHAAL